MLIMLRHYGVHWSRRTLDNQVRAEDTHGRDTNTGLSGSVGSAET